MLSRTNKQEVNEFSREENQYVVFVIGKEEFGVDIKLTREIINSTELTVIPNAPEIVQGVINLRGEIVPVVDLNQRLAINRSELAGDLDDKIIIIEINQMLVGMKVNEVKGIIRLTADDIGETPSLAQGINKEYITGVGKLENRLLILLNLTKILSEEEVRQLDKIEVEL